MLYILYNYNKRGKIMPRKKKDKYVSDFVKIQDVCSNGITAIWSGVGSGKNGFIEGVHSNEVKKDGTVEKIDIYGLCEYYRVLLITSRKAKVSETKIKHAKDISPFLSDVRHIDDVNFDDYDNKSLVCTTAHIKSRIQKDYSPSCLAPEPFWKKFDFVIIDEFHSLVADATFSDTAFIMKCFVDKVYEDCIKGKQIEDIKPKMIFMSGTPNTTKNLLAKFSYKEFDLFDKAKYVKPKSINFTYYKNAVSSICECLKKDGTVVYYMCLLDKIQDLIDVAKEIGIAENQIAVSVSNKDTIRMLKAQYKSTVYSNIDYINDYLSANMALPSEIKLFITNSKNKEGININTSPDLLVIEHHCKDDIIQICGRFRNSVKNVKVIYDAEQFSLPLAYYREEEYQREQGLLAANNFFLKLVDENNIDLENTTVYYEDVLYDFVTFIEKSTPFIRYNPFSNKFEMNDCYIQARNDYIAGLCNFKSLMNDYKIHKTINFTDYFYRNIDLKYTPSFEPFDLLQEYMKSNSWELGVTILSEKQNKKILRDLNKIYNNQPTTRKKEYKDLGRLLHYFGCKKQQYGRAINKQFKIIQIDNAEIK